MQDSKHHWFNQPWTGAAAVIAVPLLAIVVLIGGLPARVSRIEDKLDRLTTDVLLIRGELHDRNASARQDAGGAAVTVLLDSRGGAPGQGVSGRPAGSVPLTPE